LHFTRLRALNAALGAKQPLSALMVLLIVAFAMEQEELGALALLNTGFQRYITCYSSVLISLGALAISYLVMQAYIAATANGF